MTEEGQTTTPDPQPRNDDDFVGAPTYEGAGERIQMHRMQAGLETRQLEDKGMTIHQAIESDPTNVSIKDFVDYSLAVATSPREGS